MDTTTTMVNRISKDVAANYTTLLMMRSIQNVEPASSASPADKQAQPTGVPNKKAADELCVTTPKATYTSGATTIKSDDAVAWDANALASRRTSRRLRSVAATPSNAVADAPPALCVSTNRAHTTSSDSMPS